MAASRRKSPATPARAEKDVEIVLGNIPRFKKQLNDFIAAPTEAASDGALLKELRTSLRLSQQSVARLAGVAVRTVRRWECEEAKSADAKDPLNVPKSLLYTLKVITVLGISAFEIPSSRHGVFLSEDEAPAPREPDALDAVRESDRLASDAPTEITARHVQNLRNAGLRPKELAQRLGVTPSTVYRWIKGETPVTKASAKIAALWKEVVLLRRLD